MVDYRLTPDDLQTYRRYAPLALPRHTSYPIAPVWKSSYRSAALREDLSRCASEGRPLSLYVHVPFCERLCYYCACTKEIVSPGKRRQLDPSDSYLAGLETEIGLFADILAPGSVRQLHLGGGSPTFLSAENLHRLMGRMRERFRIEADAEVAVEIDPRITSQEQLQTLRDAGVNRISLGIQDFDPRVQKAVNRLQPHELVERCVAWCRDLKFHSINFDLIYGLPFQTLESMSETIRQTAALAPDRIAFYRLAVIPEIFRWQNVFHSSDLPEGELLLEMNLQAINQFQAAGYEFIGLDHFARREEALALAAREGSLRRTFQGMTTGKGLDVIGLGPSAISQLDDAFAQNAKSTAEWSAALAGGFATERGLHLSADDRLRRELMQQLYGYGTIDKRSLEKLFAIGFDEHFEDELQRLGELVDQGVATVSPDRIELTAPLGRLLVRVVAAVFDRYLPKFAFREGLPEAQASKVG